MRVRRITDRCASVGVLRVLFAALVVLVLLSANAPRALTQSAPAPGDSVAPAIGPVRDTLESVVIRTTRAGGATPTSATSLDRASIDRVNVGQDAPLVLLGTTGVTATSDAGGFSGYSSIRLRGVDQTRLSISMDGVPLNDPEDQVLYFSNIPDFMSSMHSVRIQRGVGSSAFGTASFAGSLNFESLPLFRTPRFSEGQWTGGSWGTQRVSIEGATGLVGNVAAYARVSSQSTDGYRARSGNEAESGFLSAGWIGARDALKLTGFAGRSRTELAYVAPSEAQLATDPRTNPMSPDERDDFRQEMVSLQHTRVLTPRATVTTTAYRNSAGGWFDVAVGSELWNFNLNHVWYGLLSTLSWEQDGFSVAAGAHLSSYARDHYLLVKPDLVARVYDNTGHKREQSAFLKGTWTRGTIDWHADLQLRRAEFVYDPSPGTTFAAPRIDWIFFSPKLGVTWRARPAVVLFASFAESAREPTRSDLFAGADDLDDAAAAQLLPLDQVHPEHLQDLELGARFEKGRLTMSANLFAMRFRNEIAPIGALSVTGNPLRRNVGRSSRVGVELEGTLRARPTLLLTANAMLMRARIAEYRDDVAAVTYRDVPPLLSPAVLANAQLLWTPSAPSEVAVALRHVGESQLANDGNAAFVTPAYTIADLGLSHRFGRNTVRAQIQNLFDVTAYTNGYSDGVTRYFIPLAARTLLVTIAVTF